MELVTREEFDATGELLASTRKRLEVLERTVADLESRRPGDGPQVGFGTDGSAASAADS
jgi:BMFP domain-containing protein YqiC